MGYLFDLNAPNSWHGGDLGNGFHIVTTESVIKKGDFTALVMPRVLLDFEGTPPAAASHSGFTTIREANLWAWKEYKRLSIDDRGHWR
jgi:hypothetical protein